MMARLFSLIPDPLDRVWCALAFAIVVGVTEGWLP